jgi:hypothetical protein
VVANAEDADRLSLLMEADAPVADAETEVGRVDTLEPLDVPGATLCEATESRENPRGSIQSMVFSGK